MTKKEIISEVAMSTGLTKNEAALAVEATVDAIAQALIKDESVFIRGFATFKPVVRKKRTARNITNGKYIEVPERKTAKLIPSRELKEAMNG